MPNADQLAERLMRLTAASISKAFKVMELSRDTFYRYKSGLRWQSMQQAIDNYFFLHMRPPSAMHSQ